MYPDHLDDVPTSPRRHPGLTIVVDHLGKPPLGTDEMAAWEELAAGSGRAAERRTRRSPASTRSTRRRRLDRGRPPARGRRRRRRVRPDAARCGSDWPVALLNGDYERVWRETTARVERAAGAAAGQILQQNATALYRLDPDARGTVYGEAMSTATGRATDQAIAKIKELISSGEFTAGVRLPTERELTQRFGISRSSLREAMRALALVGVLESRVGDGTYVTTLEPSSS